MVRDAAAAIDFYKRAFGATERSRVPGPDGKSIIHAELRIGDSALFLMDESPAWGSKSPLSLGTSPVLIHLYVEDVAPMLDKPQIVQTVAQPAAVIRLTVPRKEIRNVMGPAIAEAMATVAAQGIGPAGPVFSHHLKMDPDIFDFEVGVPVTAPVSAAGRVKAGQLPAATVARTVYHGPYEGLGSAWGEFDAWIAAEGHTPAPDL